MFLLTAEKFTPKKRFGMKCNSFGNLFGSSLPENTPEHCAEEFPRLRFAELTRSKDAPPELFDILPTK